MRKVVFVALRASLEVVFACPGAKIHKSKKIIYEVGWFRKILLLEYVYGKRQQKKQEVICPPAGVVCIVCCAMRFTPL